MNQAAINNQPVDIRTLLKNKRAEKAEENASILAELGISMEGVVGEIKAEMKRVEIIICRHLSKDREKQKRIFNYEAHLQWLIQMSEWGTKNSLEIQEGLKEIKERFVDVSAT